MNEPLYTLADCAARAAADPGSFRRPSRDALRALGVGSLCKLIFLAPEGPDALRCDGERMWVRVERVGRSASGLVYQGRLDNAPVRIRGLALGVLLEFSARHVADLDDGASVRGSGT